MLLTSFIWTIIVIFLIVGLIYLSANVDNFNKIVGFILLVIFVVGAVWWFIYHIMVYYFGG